MKNIPNKEHPIKAEAFLQQPKQFIQVKNGGCINE